MHYFKRVVRGFPSLLIQEGDGYCWYRGKLQLCLPVYSFFPFIFTKLSGTRFEDIKNQLRKRMFRKRKVRRINFIIAGKSIELNTYAVVRPTNPGLFLVLCFSLYFLNAKDHLCLLFCSGNITWLDSVTNLPIKVFCNEK